MRRRGLLGEGALPKDEKRVAEGQMGSDRVGDLMGCVWRRWRREAMGRPKRGMGA